MSLPQEKHDNNDSDSGLHNDNDDSDDNAYLYDDCKYRKWPLVLRTIMGIKQRAYLIIPILQMRKLKLWETKWLAQDLITSS